MSHPNITCQVCGGSDFTADAGFFFCLECNTQSQDVREEVYSEYFGTQKGTTRVLQKKSLSRTGVGDNENLTSWEVLNYVLKGITDELINLGAKPLLKIVTLQLWASYLRELEIAFTSVDIERKPKLGYTFKRSDAKIIYGITEQQLKEKSWRTKARSHSAASSVVSTSDSDTNTSGSGLTRRSILRKLTIRKKALASAEYTQLSQESTRSFSQTLEELDSASETTETPKRMKVTKHAKSLLSSSCASSTDDDERKIQRRLSVREGRSVRNVTLAKVVALVNIALALTKHDIQVSDFLRWVEEGHISLKTARKFLPEETKLDPTVQRMLEVDQLSYVKCQLLIAGMCKELEIAKLPQPDLNVLTDRYCLELQLPREMVDIVKQLIRLSTSTKSYKEGKHISNYCGVQETKSVEVKVMSAVIVVMKLLFSLDDCTEYRLSHTASELNRVSKAEEHWTRLFVFSEWMQFIECRKAVVSCYHLPTQSSVYGDVLRSDPELFLQHYRQVAGLPEYRENSKRYALNKTWVEALTRCLRMLVDKQPGSVGDHIKFPASLTPLHSCTQVLLSQHAERVTAVRDVLSQDFTGHSIQHVLDTNRCVALGIFNDLNIVQRNGVATTFQVKKVNPRDKDTLVIPRYRINQINVAVDIVKKIKPNKEKNKTDPRVQELKEKRLSDLEEIISDDSEEEINAEDKTQDQTQSEELSSRHSTLELFNTYGEYWFCHCNLNKNSSTLEEFEVFAKRTFSSSFLWLLRECSRMIGFPARDLYANVMYTEGKYKHILNESHYLLRKGKRKR